MSDLPAGTRTSVAGNIEQWTRVNEEYGDGQAQRQWLAEEITWGEFGVREEDIGSPLGDVRAGYPRSRLRRGLLQRLVRPAWGPTGRP